MRQRIYGELQRVARAQETTNYGHVAQLAGLDLDDPPQRDLLAKLLGDISTQEHRLDRPMLSAVVVSSEENMPGKGFFTLARELGLHRGRDDLAFFVRELRRVHSAWKETP